VNLNGGECTADLHPESRISMKKKEDSWTLSAQEDDELGYSEKYCVECTPDVGDMVTK
jgi:hypothetical protein